MMMERYSGRLEEVVSALEDEKRKTDALLYKMLPKLVLQAKNGCDIAAFSLKCCSCSCCYYYQTCQLLRISRKAYGLF